mgnify:CR=1 FL=1
MPKKKYLRKLPAWFDINNYVELKKLDPSSLINQVNARSFLLSRDFLDIDCDDEAHLQIKRHSELVGQELWSSIKKGKVVTNQFFDNHGLGYGDISKIPRPPLPQGRFYISDLLKPFKLSSGGGYSVQPIDFHNLRLLNLYQKRDLINKIPFEFEDKDFFCSSASIDKLINNDFSVNLVVNLKEHTDKYLLEQIKELLPKWRKELNITEPKSSMFMSNIHLQKIVDYQVIPYLDLLYHQKIENVKIPHRVIVETFFVNQKMLYTEVEFRQVILKFIKKITSLEFRYTVER